MLRIAIGRSTKIIRERMVTCIFFSAAAPWCDRQIHGQRNNDVVRKNCDLRVAVRTSKYQDTFLARPDDDFWPMARYKAKFGSPLLPKNKKLGHVTAICDGIKGVIAPGDDGVGRYKIKNRSGIRVEKDEEEDIGSGSDDQKLADAKFAELREEHTKMYQQLAVGAMGSLLNDFAMDSDERDQEEAKLKAAAKGKNKYERRRCVRRSRRKRHAEGCLHMPKAMMKLTSTRRQPGFTRSRARTSQARQVSLV